MILLTEVQVAEVMGVTTHAVRKWRREGKIAFIKVNNTVRFEEQEVVNFIARNRKAPLCVNCEQVIDNCHQARVA